MGCIDGACRAGCWAGEIDPGVGDLLESGGERMGGELEGVLWGGGDGGGGGSDELGSGDVVARRSHGEAEGAIGADAAEYQLVEEGERSVPRKEEEAVGRLEMEPVDDAWLKVCLGFGHVLSCKAFEDGSFDGGGDG